MKVQVITKYFLPVTAGIETNILETYSILRKIGWEVILHTTQDTLTEKNVLPKKDTIRGIPVNRYPFGWYGFLPSIDWDSSGVIALHNFNIVPHFYILMYSLFLKVIGRKKFKLVLIPHGGFNPEWSIFPKLVAGFKKFYHYTIGVFLINATVDVMRAVSEWERQEIFKKGVKKDIVYTITNGIESEAYTNVDMLASKQIKEKVKKFGRYIIQIGRIYPIKNYEITIRALPKIPSDIRFVIAGPIQEDEKYLDFLKKLIRDLHVEDRVIFLGIIRGVDKYYLIKYAQMMVHMAKYESFCNVVHEGMSQGLVCIVANNTALPLLIRDGVNGYCLETYDQESLAEKINFVLKNKNSSFIKDIEKRNRETGLETSWENVAKKLDVLYKKS